MATTCARARLFRTAAAIAALCALWAICPGAAAAASTMSTSSVPLATAPESMPPGVAAITPAAGATLVASPAAFQVTLSVPAGSLAQLQVFDARGNLVGGPTSVSGNVLSVRLPHLGDGTYTAVWRAGALAGASTFRVWSGGPLPPALLRAAYGGPTASTASLWSRLWMAVALAAGLFLSGASLVATPRARAGARFAAVVTAGAAVGAALDHTALAAGLPLPGLVETPLFAAVLLRGVALDVLLGGALALLAGALAAPLAAVPAALSLLALLAGLPQLRGGPLLLVWAFACGAAAFAGALPAVWVGRRQADPAAAGRYAGLALAVLAGTPLWLRFHPVGGPSALVGVAASGLLLPLGLLAPRRRAAAAAGAACVCVLAVAAAGPLERPNALARGPAPQATVGATGTLRVAASDGADTVALSDPRATAAALAVTALRMQPPHLEAVLWASRIGGGRYVMQTDALALPGDWRLSAAGATVTAALGTSVATCTEFPGAAARLANLGAPVTALAVDAEDGDVALAATSRSLYWTADGGSHWTAADAPAGGPVRALAVGQYGHWLAENAMGLSQSPDGGRTWTPVGGASGAGGIAAPLGAQGGRLWAVAGAQLFEQQMVLQFFGPLPVWHIAGSAPGGAAALLALPVAGALPPVQVNASTVPPPVVLAAAGQGGLAVSSDGGATWRRSLAQPASDAAAAPDGLWVAGPHGVFHAPSASGPWVQAAGSGGNLIAAEGPSGQTVVVARPDAGLVRSSDGGRTWQVAGCPLGTATALQGTYAPGGTTGAPGAPAYYVGDASGDVAAVMGPS